MSPFLKRLLAIIIGILTAFVIMTIVEGVGSNIYPIPEGSDPNSMEGLRKIMESRPVGAFLIVILGHLLGALCGGAVAKLIDRSNFRNALIVGGLLMVFGLLNLVSLPHPLWFWLDLFIYMPAAYLGAKLVSGKR